MIINDLEYFKRSSNYTSLYSGMDHPRESLVTEKDWHAYPVQDFDYKFNSWGFRGPEYNNYIGKPVNICLGDSFTVNVGGPIEYSWCSQLAKNFDIPTLNLGMDGASNDAIKLVYDRACEIFDVRHTFVMYTFMHRRLQNKKFIHYVTENDNENLQHFLNHRIPNATEAGLVKRCYTDNEFYLLSNLGIYIFEEPHQCYVDCKDTVDQNRPAYISKDSYNKIRGGSWPTFKEFIKGADPHPDMFTKELGDFVENRLLYTNRDGYHMNKDINKVYADYFYTQWKEKNES